MQRPCLALATARTRGACDGSGRNPARTRARATRRGGRVVAGRVRRGRARRARGARGQSIHARWTSRRRAPSVEISSAPVSSSRGCFEPRRPSRPTRARPNGAASCRRPPPVHDFLERIAIASRALCFRPRRRIRRRVEKRSISPGTCKRRRTRDVSTHVAKHFANETSRPPTRRDHHLAPVHLPGGATKRQRRIACLAVCRVRIAAALSPLTALSSTKRVHSRKHRVLTARAFCMQSRSPTPEG